MQKPNKKKEFENGKNIPLLLGFPLGEAKFTLENSALRKRPFFSGASIFFFNKIDSRTFVSASNQPNPSLNANTKELG
jgi:hypothetical protein